MNFEKIAASMKQERKRIRVTTSGGAKFEVNCIEYKFDEKKKYLKAKRVIPKGWSHWNGMIVRVEELSGGTTICTTPL
jgi:hypothetical protein